jgi:hypothetical protein
MQADAKNVFVETEEEKQMFLDPISGGIFTDPVLASDGITYDYDTIKTVMEYDELKLSPITKEPLRNVVFVHNHLRDLLGLGRLGGNLARPLYKKIEYRGGREGVIKTVYKFNPKDIITDVVIVCLLQKLNLWDKVLLLKVVLRQEDDRWAIFGPPPIADLEKRLVRFIESIHFEKIYKNPDRFGSSLLYVYDPKTRRSIKYATLEHILGSLIADDCFDE